MRTQIDVRENDPNDERNCKEGPGQEGCSGEESRSGQEEVVF